MVRSLNEKVKVENLLDLFVSFTARILIELTIRTQLDLLTALINHPPVVISSSLSSATLGAGGEVGALFSAVLLLLQIPSPSRQETNTHLLTMDTHFPIWMHVPIHG